MHHIPGNHDVHNNGRVTTLPGVTPHSGKLTGVKAYVGGGLTSWRDTLGNRTGTPGRVSPRLGARGSGEKEVRVSVRARARAGARARVRMSESYPFPEP